jgi:hypothetical protein
LNFIVTANSDVAAGYLDITTVKTHEDLNYHAEKFLHLRKG